MRCPICQEPLDQPGDLCRDCDSDAIHIAVEIPADFDTDPDRCEVYELTDDEQKRQDTAHLAQELERITEAIENIEAMAMALRYIGKGVIADSLEEQTRPIADAVSVIWEISGIPIITTEGNNKDIPF